MPQGLVVALVLGGTAAAIGVLARALDRPVPARLLLVFTALAVLPFPSVLVGDRTPVPIDHVPLTIPWVSVGTSVQYNPYLNDVATQMLPWTQAVREAWAAGSLPLWDRWNGCGAALAANSQSCAFSPWTLLLFPLPLLAAFTAMGSAKLVVAMAGTWLWMRELGR